MFAGAGGPARQAVGCVREGTAGRPREKSQINGGPLGWVRGTCTMRTARKQPANYWRSVRAIDPASGRRHGAVREDDTDGPRRRSAQQPRARGAGPAGASLVLACRKISNGPSALVVWKPLLGSCARDLTITNNHTACRLPYTCSITRSPPALDRSGSSQSQLLRPQESEIGLHTVLANVPIPLPLSYF